MNEDEAIKPGIVSLMRQLASLEKTLAILETKLDERAKRDEEEDISGRIRFLERWVWIQIGASAAAGGGAGYAVTLLSSG